MDKPCSGDKWFLVAIVDFIPKSVTQREDHSIKVLCLSISWNYFFWVVSNFLSAVTMDHKERGLRMGDKR